MQNIAYPQLKDRLAQNITVVNVLPAEAFAKNHIPNSINIPLESLDFTAQVEAVIGSKEAPVVVYCASYSCDASKKAASKLDQAGFANVLCYEGGMKEWQEKNAARVA